MLESASNEHIRNIINANICAILFDNEDNFKKINDCRLYGTDIQSPKQNAKYEFNYNNLVQHSNNGQGIDSMNHIVNNDASEEKSKNKVKKRSNKTTKLNENLNLNNKKGTMKKANPNNNSQKSSMLNQTKNNNNNEHQNNRMNHSFNKQSSHSRYKTELCRQYIENGVCKYSEKCQFAHGEHELKNIIRHPKYKTDLCKTFYSTGFCPYGPRCHFIHESEEKRVNNNDNNNINLLTKKVADSLVINNDLSIFSSSPIKKDFEQNDQNININININNKLLKLNDELSCNSSGSCSPISSSSNPYSIFSSPISNNRTHDFLEASPPPIAPKIFQIPLDSKIQKFKQNLAEQMQFRNFPINNNSRYPVFPDNYFAPYAKTIHQYQQANEFFPRQLIWS